MKNNFKPIFQIEPHEFSQEEEYGMDIYICPECQRRFMVLNNNQ